MTWHDTQLIGFSLSFLGGSTGTQCQRAICLLWLTCSFLWESFWQRSESSSVQWEEQKGAFQASQYSVKMSADPEIRQTAADVNGRRQMEQLDQRSQRLYLWQKTPVAWSKAITVKLPGWGNVVLSRDGLECFHVVTLKITCLCLDSECKNVFCILRLQSRELSHFTVYR